MGNSPCLKPKVHNSMDDDQPVKKGGTGELTSKQLISSQNSNPGIQKDNQIESAQNSAAKKNSNRKNDSKPIA